MGSIETLPSGNISAIARDPATGKRRRRGFKGATYEVEKAAWAWIRSQEGDWDQLSAELGEPVTRHQKGWSPHNTDAVSLPPFVAAPPRSATTGYRG